ncbi:polysaccharide deacetylase family protein [Agromyces aurantiacus]|uniref:Polysaccharide deacetylase family protein n=1 Tax=Agromyces aurantiacus TaxID=165814 RepID=A0ABV9R7S0_9MICO|nr:polysaccharide deacetylase family protein [Agromyces aurantiacus]MBM7503055.1 peptidoglycan/xylan/chitin deacetylase (PgdA/CDA1 family) [Agromyces aurantiacus]
MGDVTRRALLAAAGLGAVVVFGKYAADRSAADAAGGSQGAPQPAAPPAPAIDRVAVPAGELTALPPEAGNVMAWTVDDGTSSAVVGAYTAFAARTGIRLTYFVNGTYASWDEQADAIRPLVASGQIQLANHTWSHPDLSTLDDASIQAELQRNHDYLAEVYGVDARPYFRPPYGVHDARVDAAAAAIGYTVPTLWYGSLGDSGELADQQIVDLATEWFGAGRIVIGHLNHEPVTRVFDRLEAILEERGLTTVTLNDVFTSEQHP